MTSGNPLVLDVLNIALDGCLLIKVLKEYFLDLSALHTHTHTHIYIYINPLSIAGFIHSFIHSFILVTYNTCLKQTRKPSLPLQPHHLKDNPLQHTSCLELVHCISHLPDKALLGFLKSVWLLHSELHTAPAKENSA